MEKLNRKKLVQKILNSLWPIESSGEELKINASTLAFMRDGWLIYFSNEAAKEFQEAIDLLTKYAPLTNKYSTSAINGSFESLAVKLLSSYDKCPPTETIKNEVDNWLESLEKQIEHHQTFFALIENLKVEDEQNIGLVKIEPISEKTIENIEIPIFESIDNNVVHTTEQKETIKQSLTDELSRFKKEKFSSLVSISVSTKDEDKGLQIATEHFQETIDLLRFLSAFSYQSNLKQSIALQGENPSGERMFFMFSDNASWKIYYRHISFPFVLNNDQLARFTKLRLQYLSSILKKNPEQRYEIENRLINAIHWISEAIQETSDTARFLKFCICLESLFCGPGEEVFGTTIGERLAFILESSKEKRQEIFHKTKSIYSIRSKIAHEGRPENVENLLKLMPYALTFAIHAISKISVLVSEFGWQTFDEMRQYFEDLKFS